MELPRMNEGVTTPLDPEIAAETMIRNYCGWHVAPEIQQTLTLDGNGHQTLLLPSNRVLEVQEVRVDGEPVDGYTWSEKGSIKRLGAVWPNRDRAIEVDLKHGYAHVEDLLQVIQGIRARARMAPTGVVTLQRAGTQTVGMASAGGTVGSFPLLDQEKRVLDGYRLVWGP